jgi:hypothetical protein
MHVLSVFVDESGDSDLQSVHSPYYLFCLVLHDQNSNLGSKISNLDNRLEYTEGKDVCIHTGPLIRGEQIYKHDSLDKRRSLFLEMHHFSRKCDVKYTVFKFLKKESTSKLDLEGKMSRELKFYLDRNQVYFSSFDKIIIYYDNGQEEITRILNIVFYSLFNQVESRRVAPSNYRLFQVADYFCTLELIALKLANNELSNSEKKFFFKSREPQKPYIKTMRKKLIQ